MSRIDPDLRRFLDETIQLSSEKKAVAIEDRLSRRNFVIRSIRSQQTGEQLTEREASRRSQVKKAAQKPGATQLYRNQRTRVHPRRMPRISAKDFMQHVVLTDDALEVIRTHWDTYIGKIQDFIVGSRCNQNCVQSMELIGAPVTIVSGRCSGYRGVIVYETAREFILDYRRKDGSHAYCPLVKSGLMLAVDLPPSIGGQKIVFSCSGMEGRPEIRGKK